MKTETQLRSRLLLHLKITALFRIIKKVRYIPDIWNKVKKGCTAHRGYYSINIFLLANSILLSLSLKGLPIYLVLMIYSNINFKKISERKKVIFMCCIIPVVKCPANGENNCDMQWINSFINDLLVWQERVHKHSPFSNCADTEKQLISAWKNT